MLVTQLVDSGQYKLPGCHRPPTDSTQVTELPLALLIALMIQKKPRSVERGFSAECIEPAQKVARALTYQVPPLKPNGLASEYS